jgi:hypothetical protein
VKKNFFHSSNFEKPMNETPLRCPEIGWVSEIDDGDEHFWGCGECGNVWYERSELDEAIDDIVSQFPYRKKVYRKSKGTWQPVPLEKEPEDYEELVEAEEEAEGDDGDDEIWWTLACPVSKCDGSVFFSEDGVQEGKLGVRFLRFELVRYEEPRERNRRDHQEVSLSKEIVSQDG